MAWKQAATMDRSMSLPTMRRLRSLSFKHQSDVFVVRNVSTNNLISAASQHSACKDSDTDEKEVPEEEALCRICMMELNEGNETFKRECLCKGDLTLAHKDCAIKWFSIKGNNFCDVCNSQVSNLPVILFRRTSSLQWNLDSEDEDRETSSSWQHAAAIILSSALAALWQKLEELAEFP